ncbi:hypothetical protein V1514DRAFT_201693 [Lipomyces japonicus]|uniref:uncharacterized protein n=1 Tax=Lipomyces japonicus TaxID=56871 RepID=UPI0034CE115E
MKIIDSHVHLFATPHLQNLAWMTDDNPLRASHTLDEYCHHSLMLPGCDHGVVEAYSVDGVVVIEADVKSSLNDWSHAIAEYEWVCRIIDNKLLAGEGSSSHAGLVSAIVPWAPVPAGPQAVTEYLACLRLRNPTVTDKYLKGVRYLAQDKPSGTMTSPLFIDGVRVLGSSSSSSSSSSLSNRLVFELGIDLRLGGTWQLDEAVILLDAVNSVTRIIINHYGKPDLYLSPNDLLTSDKFIHWTKAMTKFAATNSYLKLSGFFSELPVDLIHHHHEWQDMLARVLPWVKVGFELFGTDRIIWGSDWPVCTINGGKHSFNKFVALTLALFDELDLSDRERQAVFYDNAKRAYNL